MRSSIKHWERTDTKKINLNRSDETICVITRDEINKNFAMLRHWDRKEKRNEARLALQTLIHGSVEILKKTFNLILFCEWRWRSLRFFQLLLSSQTINTAIECHNKQFRWVLRFVVSRFKISKCFYICFLHVNKEGKVRERERECITNWNDLKSRQGNFELCSV